MRKIAKSGQISMPSLIELRRGLRDEGERYGDRHDVRIPNQNGNWRRPTAAYVLNWLGCYLLTRPEAERDRIISEGRAIFDRHAASDTPIGFGKEIVANPPIEEEDTNGHSRPRRRKGG